jgi:glutathione synthase/RimK-type ligase-like ATP-grasp enzyme
VKNNQTKNKILTILYSEDDWESENPLFKKSNSIFYEYLANSCNNKNIRLTRANVDWYKSGKFTKYWELRNNIWVKVSAELKPNCVFDKSSSYNSNGDVDYKTIHQLKMIEQNANIFINSVDSTVLLDNKLYQSIVFKNFLPKTQLLKQGERFLNPNNKTYVLKSLSGSGGKFVKITNNSTIVCTTDTIIQEFIDATNPSTGIVNDFRVVFLAEEIIYCMKRYAKKGSVITNISFASYNEILPVSEFTSDIECLAIKTSKKIRKIFAKKWSNLLVAIDFVYDYKNSKLYLIEVNSAPGFTLHTNGITIDYSEKHNSILLNYTEKLVSLFLK